MTKPTDAYFAVSFKSELEAEQFSLQALNACAGPLGTMMLAGESRPVEQGRRKADAARS